MNYDILSIKSSADISKHLGSFVNTCLKSYRQQGHNQERGNRTIVPSKIFVNIMAFTYSTRKLILETAFPLR